MMPDMSSEEICKVAHWAGFPEDATWLARVAGVLRHYDHAADAISFYERSVGISEHSFTYGGMAEALFKTGDRRGAIVAITNSLHLAPHEDVPGLGQQDIRACKHDSLDLLCTLYTAEGQETEAVRALKEAAADTDCSGYLLWTYLDMLLEKAWYEEALKTINEYIAGQQGQPYGNLLEFFRYVPCDPDFGRLLNKLAVELNAMDAVERLFRYGIGMIARLGSDGETAAFRYSYATFLLRGSSVNEEKAVDYTN